MTASRWPTSSPTTRSTTTPTVRTATTVSRTTARGTAASRVRPTTTAIRALRARQQRNVLATLLLSQGVPMILHGDELGRTQEGNNNTYAQDSEISWIDWDAADLPLIEFVAAVVQLRRQHPTFRRARFFDGRPVRREEGAPLPDIEWYRPDGSAMSPEDWDAGFGKAIARVPQRRRHPGARPTAASRSPTPASCCSSTPTTTPSSSRSPATTTAHSGRP